MLLFPVDESMSSLAMRGLCTSHLRSHCYASSGFPITITRHSLALARSPIRIHTNTQTLSFAFALALSHTRTQTNKQTQVHKRTKRTKTHHLMRDTAESLGSCPGSRSSILILSGIPHTGWARCSSNRLTCADSPLRRAAGTGGLHQASILTAPPLARGRSTSRQVFHAVSRTASPLQATFRAPTDPQGA
jgi:hypothetical protein